MIATLANVYGRHVPLWLYNSASGLVFFLGGYIIGKRTSILAMILSLLIWLGISLIIPVGVNMRTNDLTYGNYIVWWIYSFAGIYSVNCLVNFIPVRFLDNKCNIFRLVGVYSMDVYAIHWILLLIPIAIGLV